ncbi:hypothetical protein EIP91_007341 [Steccherinum ochraceum]|uniref:NIPA-like protein 3 n=1 Tax=Steccherinum ochraceum TaxID=92696 RepID=A0A4R0S3Z2_9APHY|nr:hypothetical protein EIP91_007341 [Steccherinum ochraceum]
MDGESFSSTSSTPSASLTSLISSAIPTPTDVAPPLLQDAVPAHHASPVVAFIIGLAIVILASILNAAGLNLTKLDHVRTSAIPKASRKRDWLRPLWLLGMILYILSQLIGSTLALEYMRAEYVAPLGSTSLIFNFLFAKFLINSPVTMYDIWGTIIVIFGVIGIVAFGSINHGLDAETNAEHLTYLWTRGNWLGYFFVMSFALMFVSIFTSQLDTVLAARADLSAAPFTTTQPLSKPVSRKFAWLFSIKSLWSSGMMWTRAWLEHWTAAHDDKRIAWTLGIGWACLGGGLAGGTLVFAKASVKLISGSLSHENTGNQFGHASAIFTFILLAVTAVLQIICLNRGLKVYDSTLVVPVFYGVYTAVGFLNSLIFNNEVDAYEPWALFLIFVSILILVTGVVLLTHKKPDNHHASTATPVPGTSLSPMALKRRARGTGKKVDDEEEGLTSEGHDPAQSRGAVVWQVGDVSDEEEDDGEDYTGYLSRRQPGLGEEHGVGERQRILEHVDDEDEDQRASTSSDATLARADADPDEEFGKWEATKAST